MCRLQWSPDALNTWMASLRERFNSNKEVVAVTKAKSNDLEGKLNAKEVSTLRC